MTSTATQPKHENIAPPDDTTNAQPGTNTGTGALAPPVSTDVAAQNDDGFSDFAGQGLQGLNRDDLAIPFLVILQSNSPQVKRSEGAYIEGAFEGMLHNTVTGEIIDPVKERVTVIPCYYDRNFVEWRVRESGGGFVAQHPVDTGLRLQADAMRDDKNRDILPNGHQINDTRTFLCMFERGDGSKCPVFITLTSTQIKKARQWLMQQSLLKLKKPGTGELYTPPMFASRWRISTVPEGNEKGSWMGWAFTHEGYLKGATDPLFVEAKALHESMKEGKVKADYTKSDPEATGTGGNGGGKRGDDGLEDDIPF